MDLEECKKKIDRYLSKDHVQPMIVDVQNQKDWSAIVTYYNVGANQMLPASDYCKEDGLPRMDSLFHELSQKRGVCFVTGMSSFLKLEGEQELKKFLHEILSLTVLGHIVVLTFQCKKYLQFKDLRIHARIAIVDGESQPLPGLIFIHQNLLLPKKVTAIEGMQNFAASVESDLADKLYIVTEKKKDAFPYSLYRISELNKAYDVLVQKDPRTSELGESLGTDQQWEYALDLFEKSPRWVNVMDLEFGNHLTLEVCTPAYSAMGIKKQWLYYIGLKLFGAKNWCLDAAISKSSSEGDFISNIYRCILDKNVRDKDFWYCYEIRKTLLRQIGNPPVELTSFCKAVAGKGKERIYYLTDNTQQEREAMFAFLDQYGMGFKKEELMEILHRVYPDLYAYLQPYRFKNDFLDYYFQTYKYQKVINKILPEFEKIVEEQAVRRDYNLLLEPRSSMLEKLNTDNAQLYFMDAMGVEYLGYILAVCKGFNLIADITVCRCELPSITCKNKEFLETFEGGEHPIVYIKDMDEIKHHGKDNYDYYKYSKYPIHLMRELEILHESLGKIRNKLIAGTIGRAYMIADHGASRLAVLHGSENIWEMSEKGRHSGRCCPKSDVDEQPELAADAADFWALANYDRFKGGRKANVEVHGGATLEEICVPIIELTYIDKAAEAYLMPVGADAVDFANVPEIEVSFRKKAALKIFVTSKFQNVGISVAGKYYEAEELENNFYRVDMPDMKKPGLYEADIYAGDNLIAEKRQFFIKREGQREKELL